MFRRDQICNHVPAALAPLARALAQILAPVARRSPQRCCCGNSMAMSICQTASSGRAALAQGAQGPPGARRRRRAAGAPAGPALPARRGRLRRATDLWREISRGKMASPEPEESWSNHIHTHTRPHAHTLAHGRAASRLILAGAKKNYICTYISPSLRSMLFFFSFLQRMDWRFKKCCRVWARRRRRAEDEGAFAELCSSVRGSGWPCPPARWSARGRYCCRRRRRSMAAPVPRPRRVPSPTARPRPRRALEWGRARVPASRALSRVPESY